MRNETRHAQLNVHTFPKRPGYPQPALRSSHNFLNLALTEPG